MSYKPRVFISHSAREPETHTLCRAVADHLDSLGYEVLWDQNLQTAAAWRSVIDEWIWTCDAAVLVLSDGACDSRYVAYEAALLRQRWKSRSGEFPLLPIWCPGTTEKVLVDRMGALQLSEIHTNIRVAAWPADPSAASTLVDDVVARVATGLQDLLTQVRPRHDVEDLLFKELNNGTSSKEALRDIALAYKMTPVPTAAKRDLALAVVRHMLDFGVPIGSRRFERLAEGIDTMRAAMVSAERVPRVLNLIAPFCWVPPEAAARVAAFWVRPPGQMRAMAWRRSWSLSERMYVYRGYCTRSTTTLKIVYVSDGAGGEATSILEHIRSVLARELCHDQTAGTASVTARIAYLSQRGVPVFLLLPVSAVDGPVLSEVSRLWSEVCIFLFGEELDESQVRDQFPGVEFVAPPLTVADESTARAGWGDCMVAAGIAYDDLASGAAFLL